MRDITVKYGEQIRFIVKDSSNKDTIMSVSGYVVDARILPTDEYVAFRVPAMVRPHAEAIYFEFRQTGGIVIEGTVIEQYPQLKEG